MFKRWLNAPRTWFVAALLLGVGGVCFLPVGCGPTGPTKYKVAYIGLTCEAPIFAAQEKGFFKEEGVDVELVSTDWDSLQAGLSTGRFDANHTLLMYLLRSVDSGLDVKITGGIHTGCLRIQAAAGSTIKTVAELRGKNIGVPAPLGSPPHMFAARVLAAAGFDVSEKSKDVTFTAIDGPSLGAALKNHTIDAVATAEPLGSRFIGDKIVEEKAIADQELDAPYKDEYCCVSVVSGKLAREHPEVAAKLTRALLKASKWVGQNQQAAAELSVDKKYVPSSPNIKTINTQALLKLSYSPAVAKCRDNLGTAAADMKRAGLLKPTTDPAELAKRAWLDLDGVTDDWINSLKLEATARPAVLSPAEFAALFVGRNSCCGHCCCIGE